MPIRNQSAKYIFLTLAAVALALVFSGCRQSQELSILNVSYDPTREFYKEYNALFSAQ